MNNEQQFVFVCSHCLLDCSLSTLSKREREKRERKETKHLIFSFSLQCLFGRTALPPPRLWLPLVDFAPVRQPVAFIGSLEQQHTSVDKCYNAAKWVVEGTYFYCCLVLWLLLLPWFLSMPQNSVLSVSHIKTLAFCILLVRTPFVVHL